MSLLLDPAITPGETPPFHRIPPLAFQQICRELLAREPEIATCDVFGVLGESQYGIDVIAYVSDSVAVEVGQCKCYRTITERQIRAASDEFLKHIELWQRTHVRRFILFVACDVEGRREQEAYLAERRRFRELEIRYELWSGSTLRTKLQPHPDIIVAHLANAEHWIKVICGKALETYPVAPAANDRITIAVSEALTTHLDAITSQLAQLRGQQVEDLRRAWREGRRHAAWDGVQAIRGDTATWAALPAEIQARLLCLEGGLILDLHGDLTQARACADEARALASIEQEVRLRALIAYHEHGPTAALDILEGQQDTQSLALAASLLLETHQLVACQDMLVRALAAPTPLIPEGLRVQALLNLSRGETEAAQVVINQALVQEPQWEHLRTTAAIVAYARCLSPAVVPRAVLPWPEPIDWAFLRRDDASRDSLRAAEAHFATMCATAERGVAERKTLTVWQLACLANDPERQDAAASLCQTMLHEDASNVPAIAWALARRFPIDRRALEQRCHRLLDQHQATVNHVLVLVLCYLDTDRAHRAVRLLDRTRQLFRDVATPLWQTWRARAVALAGRGRAPTAAGEIGILPDDQWHIDALALRRVAQRTHDYAPLRDHLAQAYAATGQGEWLYEYGAVLARLGEWVAVAVQADEIIATIATSDALRLAVLGCFHTRQYQRCLMLLEQHQMLFQHQALPPQLRRVRALCKQYLGIVVEALNDAEALALEDPTTDNLFLLAQVAAGIGERAVVERAARRLVNRPDLEVEQAIALTDLVQHDDADLARALWRQVASAELPDALIAHAIDLGFQLDLDDEIVPLLQRGMALAALGRGGLELLAFQEAAVRFQQLRTQAQEVEAAYARGAIPVHFTAGAQHTLADRYHRLLLANAAVARPDETVPLLIRHGGRTLPDSVPDERPAWRLHMDLSALLLAAHTEILDTVETTFNPIGISPHIIPSLVALRAQIRPAQPRQLRYSEQLVDLIERAIVQVAPASLPACDDPDLLALMGTDKSALYVYACAQGGYLLDDTQHRPQDAHEQPRALPAAVLGSTLTCRALVETLRRHGPLTEDAYAAALARLGEEGQHVPVGELALLGMTIVCAGATAELLLQAQLLAVAAERFRLVLTTEAVGRARALIIEHAERQRLSAWLDVLQRRISDGILAGRYRVLPLPLHDERVDDDWAPNMIGLQDVLVLLRSNLQAGDVVWIDDRFVTRHSRMGDAPIIGIVDVLQALVGAGSLSEAAYYHILITLRDQDVRFLPLTCNEILHHLRQTVVDDGRVVETSDLQALRRSIARCLLPGTSLQWPSAEEITRSEYAEAPFALGLSHAVLNAIAALWSSGDDIATCEAYADWILEHLYVPMHALRRLTAPALPAPDDRSLAAASIASLIIRGITLLDPPATHDSPRRRAYFTWLGARVLDPAFERDPELLAPAAEVIKQCMVSIQDEHWDERTAQAAIAVLRRWYDELPAPIRREMQQDPTFLRHLRTLMVETVPISGVVFRATEFYEAARAVLNGRVARVSAMNTDQMFVLEIHQNADGYTTLDMIDVRSSARERFAHPVLDALYEDVERRTAALRRHRSQVDYGREDFERLIAEVNAIDDPDARMERVQVWWRSSAEVFYIQLGQRVRQTGTVNWPDVTPNDADGLLRHYRLSPDIAAPGSLADTLDATARQLLADEGLLTAIDRFSRLPVSLPSVLVDAAVQLPIGEQRSLLARLLRRGRTPLLLIQLVRLLTSLPEEHGKYTRLVRRLIVRLLEPTAEPIWTAFQTIITWTNTTFGWWEAARGWPPSLRLVMTWAHAEALLRTLIRAGAEAEALTVLFDERRTRLAREIFDRDRTVWFDICHPRLLRRESFLLAGLTYALGGQAPELLDIELRARIMAATFVLTDHGWGPSVPLLLDPACATNVLGSWLSGDPGVRLDTLIDANIGARFDRARLRALAHQALDALVTTPSGLEHWIMLRVAFGDVPPQAEVTDQVRALLREIDFPALIHSVPSVAEFALRTTAWIAASMADQTLAQAVQEHLLVLARSMSTIEVLLDDPQLGVTPAERSRSLRRFMLDTALHTAVMMHVPQDVVPGMAAIVLALMEADPAMAAECRPILHYLCQALPFDQALALWPALIRARAT
jgi:hypothetical protein